MAKKYLLPCGEAVKSKHDNGYAIGVMVAQQEKKKTQVWANEKCKNCTLDCHKTHSALYMDENNKEEFIKDTYCTAYSLEYLENHKKETIEDIDEHGNNGKYLIELIIQYEENRGIFYIKGKSEDCGLLDLLDNNLIEDEMEKYFEDDFYSIPMNNLGTGETDYVSFDSIQEIKKQVVSIRFLETR